MENSALIREINAKSLGAVLFGTTGLALWPDGPFNPYDYGWYSLGGMLMFSGSAMAIAAMRATWDDYRLRRDTDKFRRDGSGLHTAGWATEVEIEAAGMFDPIEPPLGISFNGRALFGPHRLRIPHWRTLAPNGVGKTTCNVLGSVVHAALSPDRPTVITVDLKNGEIVSQVAPVLEASGIEIILIDDQKTTHLTPTSVNPFAPFLRAYRRKDRQASMMAREIALNFTPEPPDDQKGRFWRDGEREFTAFGLLTLAEFSPEDCTPTGLWRLLSSPKMLEDALIASAEETGALADYATRLLARRDANPEHYDDFLSTARRRVEIYEEGGLLEGVGQDSTFDHASIKKGGMAIFIVGNQVGGDVLAPNTVAHLAAFLQVTKQAPSRPVRFIIDEATNSPVQSLVEDFTKIRGYGGRIQFIAQADSEVRKKFGKESAETIESQCGVTQIMGVSKFEDAERLSKTLGVGVGVAESVNTPGKTGELTKGLTDQGRPIMTPNEILQMPRDEQILLIDGLRPIRCKKLAQNEIGPWGKALAPNPLEGGKLPYAPKIEITYGKGNTSNIVKHLKRPRRTKKKGRTWPFRLAQFVWLPFAAAILLGASSVGLPAFRASSTYSTDYTGQTHYHRCEYLGFAGSFTLRPPNGQCPLITFRRS